MGMYPGQPAPQSEPGSAVSAGDWWPPIDCNAARGVLRLGDVVSHERLVNALRGALVTVLGELAAWKAAQIEAGFTRLADVAPDDVIDDVTILELQFIRAVQFAAAAELAEQYRAITATNEANARADAQELTAADYRRMATHAVRDIIGETRTAVELI